MTTTMKRKLILLIALFSSILVYSQDILYKMDGNSINCKIRAVNEDVIKYKRTDTINSPVYEVKTAEVYKIRYRNGTVNMIDHKEKKRKDTIGGSILTGVIDMVFVEGGTFTMGCSKYQSDCDGDENPHKVTVDDFYIGKYEVTQKQWQDVMGTNPSIYKNCDICPVENVNWNDVQEFIQKLNSKTGNNYRLPTEAEWEYAARGGKQSKGYKYSGSNDVDFVAWYVSNSGEKPHPIGQKSSNELGLFDMSGNVWEWCSDLYGYYSSGERKNPNKNDKGPQRRVYRGGSWYSSPKHCRVSNRNSEPHNFSESNIGFRLARPSGIKQP
jgi:hypothetical protein